MTQQNHIVYTSISQTQGGQRMKILISSDSVADLPKSEFEAQNIPIIPLPITLGEQTFLDGVEVTPEIIFSFVEEKKILPKTSAVNQFTYHEFFEKYSKEYDAIVHLTISHKLSLCHENAKQAASEFENVYVVDTLTLSSGIGLLLLHAARLREEGKTPEEIVSDLERTKQLVQASFVIETLDFLHKGGRCSGLQLLGANLLKIHPSIKCTNGKLDMHKKYKGKMGDIIASYIEDTLKENPNYDPANVVITHTASDELVEQAKQILQEKSNFKNILVSQASGTITSHCGPNTLGILFLNKE